MAGGKVARPNILLEQLAVIEQVRVVAPTPWCKYRYLATAGVVAVLPGMQDRGRGTIVSVSSVNGLTTLGHPGYSAAKAGLISFTKSLAVEYGRYGIRANVICPGTVRTPVWNDRIRRKPEIFEELVKWYPLRRVVDPADLAKAAAFLASDDASAITGVVLPVDCGLMAGNIVMSSELTLEKY